MTLEYRAVLFHSPYRDQGMRAGSQSCNLAAIFTPLQAVRYELNGSSQIFTIKSTVFRLRHYGHYITSEAGFVLRMSRPVNRARMTILLCVRKQSGQVFLAKRERDVVPKILGI